jgi:hypothetical protein
MCKRVGRFASPPATSVKQESVISLQRRDHGARMSIAEAWPRRRRIALEHKGAGWPVAVRQPPGRVQQPEWDRALRRTSEMSRTVR